MTEKPLLEALRWRYATNKFNTGKILDEATLSKILEAGNLTATSFGLQPFKMVLLKGQEWKERLHSITFGQESIQTCSHLLILCARTDMNDAYVENYVHYMEHVRGLDKGVMDKYAEVSKSFINQKNKEEVKAWVARQVYIVLGNVLTACAVLGIDTCPMEGFIPEKMDELLALNKFDLRSIVICPMGYRSAKDPMQNLPKVRKPMEDMIIRL